MNFDIQTPQGVANAAVAWPELPGGITAELTLICAACGYKLKMAARREPSDFGVMVGDFLARHTAGACCHG